MHDASSLHAYLSRWHDLITTVNPTHVISDLGLIAPYVSRSLGIPTARIGTGFGNPPRTNALAGMAGRQVPAEELDVADNILASINKFSLNRHMPTTANWNELLAIDGPTLLCTTPDFDPYQTSRGDESYCGVWFYRGGGAPQWNDRSGDKVIAYLKSTVDLPLICERLGSLGANLLLVCDGVIKQIDAIRCMEHVCLSDGLIDLDQCGNSCALVICNGNHGTTLKALSLGIPVSALPLFIEQRLNAVALEQTGWGVSLPSYSTQWQAALGNLINESDLKSRLAVYSEKLRQFNAGALDRALAGVLAWISGTAAE